MRRTPPEKDKPSDAPPGDRLNWRDPAAVVRWLAGLRQSFADLDAVGLDMLRPPRSRELGPALHADHYRAARAQIVQALDYARAEPDDDASTMKEGGSP